MRIGQWLRQSCQYGLLCLFIFCSVAGHAASQPSSCDDAHPGCFPKAETADWHRLPGLITTVVDKRTNFAYLVFPKPKQSVLGRFIYQTYLRQGLGSTPVGLDRSQSGPSQVIVFELHGSQVAIRVENSAFTAKTERELKSVNESFADSLVSLSPVTEVAADGSVLVNIQKWLGRDAFGVTDRLREARQGDFKIDERLMLVDTESVHAFPDNIEIDVSQTFVTDRPGNEVSGIVPDAHAMTLILHHSLIRLPPAGFEPIDADPRTGAIASTVWDFSQPLSEPVVRHLAHRFRLEKTNPTAARSSVIKPIIFYVDNAAPPDIQKDLIEGASWWAKAFDAAGYIDAFKVEPLPAGASVLDARFNVINWVHRQTRGWSYGENVIDPRTGEIIRGAVLLGSLRARQDRMIFEGLVGAKHTGSGDAQDPLLAVNARLRQLATHETGHAIGLEHNFIASTYDDRASVMDYPPPRVLIKNGNIDLSDAYKVGIGSWDEFAIHWLYGDAKQATSAHLTEAQVREQWVRDAYRAGQRFVADGDARPVGSGIANGALWDDGPNPIDGLTRALQVRRFALDRFGKDNLRQGAPMSELRRLIVPVYLYHRYEIEAAAKWIGGSYVNYAVNGDGLVSSTPVSGADQHLALQTILQSLSPSNLELSKSQLALLSAGESDNRDIEETRELLESNTQPTFSLEAAVAAAGNSVFRAIWASARLNRVSEQSAETLSIRELINTPLKTILSQPVYTVHSRLIAETLLWQAVLELNNHLADHDVSPRVAAVIADALARLSVQVKTSQALSPEFADYLQKVLNDKNSSSSYKLPTSDKATHIPPGMPIGSGMTDLGDWSFEDSF